MWLSAQHREECALSGLFIRGKPMQSKLWKGTLTSHIRNFKHIVAPWMNSRQLLFFLLLSLLLFFFFNQRVWVELTHTAYTPDICHKPHEHDLVTSHWHLDLFQVWPLHIEKQKALFGANIHFLILISHSWMSHTVSKPVWTSPDSLFWYFGSQTRQQESSKQATLKWSCLCFF